MQGLTAYPMKVLKCLLHEVLHCLLHAGLECLFDIGLGPNRRGTTALADSNSFREPVAHASTAQCRLIHHRYKVHIMT